MFQRVPSFQEGAHFFQGWGQMLISIENYRTYDFPGGPDPFLPLSGFALKTFCYLDLCTVANGCIPIMYTNYNFESF